jgi:hypothetical protein
MSFDLHVLLPDNTVPTTAEWQVHIDSLECDVQLDPTLDLAVASGFSPATIRGRRSGFEIGVETADSWIAGDERRRSLAASASRVVTFTWGGRLAECACAMAAAAGLVRGWSAIAYDPQDDRSLDLDALTDAFAACLPEL